MSDPVPAEIEMETVLTRAVKKFFKWQLSGLTGTLIVASMLWLLVFFFFFLILVFVMCVEYHYEKRERQDAELALPKDNGKMWAEKRGSREASNTSLKKIVPIPMPPLPIEEPNKPLVLSDMPEPEPEQQPEPEPEAIPQESPVTEVLTEDSVIADAVTEQNEEPIVASPPPPSEPDVPENQNASPTEDNTQADQPDENVTTNDAEEPDPPPAEEPEETPTAVSPEPSKSPQPEPEAHTEEAQVESNNDDYITAEEPEAPPSEESNDANAAAESTNEEDLTNKVI